VNRMRKTYFLICFIAACFSTVFWTALIAFAFLTHRFNVFTSVALFGGLMFFCWGAKQMFDGYRGRL